MKNRATFRTMPALLRAIRNADLGDIPYYENIMVSMYASSLLFLAAVTTYVIDVYVFRQTLADCLGDILVFIGLGIAFMAAVRTKLPQKWVTRIISVLSLVSLLFYTFRFYQYVGPVVWIAIYIQLSLAMIRITREMFFSVAAAAVLSNAYVIYRHLQGYSFEMTGLYHRVHAMFFLIMLIVAAGVHKVNIDRYYNLKKQYHDIRRKKQEITDLNDAITASHEKTKYLAYHDNLTGLPNRLMLYEKTDRAIAAASRTGKKVAILFLDLDGFKMINDTLGHAMGDQLLIDVAKRLTDTVRQTDVVARIGGDEFNIMIENIEDADGIRAVAEKILRSLDKPFILQNQEWYISTSIGIAVYPEDGDTAVELIKNADIAMYKAKEIGRNQYVLCSSPLKEKVLETMQLNNDLYRALDRHELELYYQPQISCASEQIVGMEALIRWNHPEMGLIPPLKFIPIAEQSGLILSIGEWVLRTACGQNKAWQDAGYPPVRMAVNLSIKQLLHPNIVSQVESVLAQSDLDPRYLELEITESCAMKEREDIAQNLRALKEMGIQIAIDDFGIAYSTMTYLKVIPADIIKIDETFVQGIEKSKTDAAITKSIITLAKDMGICVIAEGVETAQQRDFLVREKCDEIQGFYYSRPMPLNALEAMWKQRMNPRN